MFQGYLETNTNNFEKQWDLLIHLCMGMQNYLHSDKKYEKIP